MSKIKVSYKIKVKTSDKIIFFITFLCFMATLTFSLMSFYNYKENQIKLKEIALKQYSNECKNSIDQYFQYNFNILEYLATYSEIYNMDWQEQYNFLSNQKHNFNFKHFIVMDLQGNDLQSINESIYSQDTEITQIVFNDEAYYASFTPLDSAEWNLVFVIKESEFLSSVNNYIIFQVIALISAILFIIFAMKIVFKGKENHKLAYTDSLTNINNRAAVNNIFKKLENNYNSSITIVCFDLNDFKYINDTYGHNIGDKLLCEFANILKETFGNIGFVARMGGDEFISILLDRDILEIENKFKEIDKLILKYNSKSIYKIKTSYGYETRKVGDNKLLQSIYEQADNNMYEFKRKSKRA